MNFDNFIGLSYLDKGRDRNGLDCWGLVRLVYSELLNIELPCYSQSYSTASDARAIAELIAAELKYKILENRKIRFIIKT